jgi:hypothetical protein
LKRRGWKWSDFGKLFEIDHTLPFNAFRLERYEDRLMVNHFTNLRPLEVHANRVKNGNYSNVELRCYKTQWRLTFGSWLRQALLFKQSRSERKPICPF